MLDDLLASNRKFSESFSYADLAGTPRSGIAVLTCMDCRIEPLENLGLELGDAVVIRNAGARATPDVVRSLLVATAILGVAEIVVMHHTKCAAVGITDEDLTDRIASTGAAVPAGFEPMAMPDADAGLKADVDLIRAALGSGARVAGWRYDVDTGLVAPVI